MDGEHFSLYASPMNGHLVYHLCHGPESSLKIHTGHSGHICIP